MGIVIFVSKTPRTSFCSLQLFSMPTLPPAIFQSSLLLGWVFKVCSDKDKQLKRNKSVIRAFRHVEAVYDHSNENHMLKLTHYIAEYLCVTLCDCWLPALKIIWCTLRVHVIFITSLPWRANWHFACVVRSIRSYGVTDYNVAISHGTQNDICIFGIFCRHTDWAEWMCMLYVRSLSISIYSVCHAATSFGCHHTRFVVITIETKWRGFKTRMWRTYLVAERV